jgi:uncharacterized membrane protein YeaQ/YmgE (transglycosylase-associated protein family)
VERVGVASPRAAYALGKPAPKRGILDRAAARRHELRSAIGEWERGTGVALRLPMTLLEFVVYLVIAGVCGSIARAFGGGTGGGFVLSILLGFLGAFIGTWIARMLHLPELFVVAIAGHPFPILWSILGGIILVVLAHALTRPRYVA